MKASDILNKMQWQGAALLAGHDLLGETYWDKGSGARWCIGKLGSSVDRCEIIAGIGGSLVVHGDYDGARFASYGDRRDAWSRLCWMADNTDLGYYVAQKASIGGRGKKDVLRYDERLAQSELRALADQWERDDMDLRAVKLFREAAAEHSEHEVGLRLFLHERDLGWDLWEHNFGMVLDDHVVISHCALNKCASLLREQYGDEGPPECRTRT